MTSRTDDINLKLADFGFAVKSGVPAAKQQAGTPGYIAPEILLGKPHGSYPPICCLRPFCYSDCINFIYTATNVLQ